MVIEEIIVADGAGILLLIILLISRYMVRRIRRPEDKIFTVFIIIGIACNFLEGVSFLVDGQSGGFFRVINMLSNSFLYLCTATVSVIWVWFVDLSLNRDIKRIKTIFLPMSIVWAVLLAALVGNVFGGYFFKVDENNVYAREPLGYIFYGFLCISFIITIIIYIRFRIKHGEAQFFPIWMFLAPVIIGCIIQVIWYGISLAWFSAAIGLLGIHVNVLSKQSSVDALTGLYNRAYIEHKLITARSNQRYAYAGIMFDVDYFKEINDTYGHSVGDEALREVARILLEATDRESMAFRFAGDEFIMIVRAPANRKEELEYKIESAKKRVKEGTDRFNSSGQAPYQLIFSMGHAKFDPKEADDTFFKHIDEAMYVEKQEHHRHKPSI